MAIGVVDDVCADRYTFKILSELAGRTPDGSVQKVQPLTMLTHLDTTNARGPEASRNNLIWLIHPDEAANVEIDTGELLNTGRQLRKIHALDG